MTTQDSTPDPNVLDEAVRGVIGTIRPADSPLPPRGWLPCDGSLYSIDQYEALFAVIGDQFGGDGRTTFAVPDLAGDHRFAICASGLYPTHHGSIRDWKPPQAQPELVARQAGSRRDAARAQQRPGRFQHVTELDPEALAGRCQAMQDAYGRGDDPLHRFLPESEIDQEQLKYQVLSISDAHQAGIVLHHLQHDHVHTDDIDPELLHFQARSVANAIENGHDPFHCHPHVSEIDQDALARHVQAMIDAHTRGQPPLASHEHCEDLDPEVMERQAQSLIDAYAAGADPLQPQHLHVDDLDPEWLTRQAKACQEAAAAGHETHSAHKHVDEIDPDELTAKVSAMQNAYAKGDDPLT